MNALASFPGHLLLHTSPASLGGSKVMCAVKKTEWETAWERDYECLCPARPYCRYATDK